MLSILHANYLGEYKVEVTFNNEKIGIADLSTLVETFKPFQILRDQQKFADFSVDYTIKWPNELDLAPEYIYFKAFENDPSLHDLFEEWGYVA